MKSYDLPCINCTSIPHCVHCGGRADWGGCRQCDPGYRPRWNTPCGFRVCQKI